MPATAEPAQEPDRQVDRARCNVSMLLGLLGMRCCMTKVTWVRPATCGEDSVHRLEELPGLVWGHNQWLHQPRNVLHAPLCC